MTTLETIHTGIDFGEGPRWHDGRLWFSDFYRHGVFSLEADGTEIRQATVDARPSGLGWMPDGTMLVVSMTDRRVLAIAPDGTRREHADLSSLASGYCNDMVVAADGTAYVGNFGFDLEADAEFATADLVRVAPDGTATAAARDLRFPNGMVITPDDTTLIVAETYGAQLTAFDIQPDGSLSNRRTWANVEGMTPDGCCLDTEGGIWVADFMNHRTLRVLQGGEITAEIPTDDRSVACMLGGPDGRTLHIMCSPSALPADVAGLGLSTIMTTTVDAPRAGRP